jgi:archaellum component FlaC
VRTIKEVLKFSYLADQASDYVLSPINFAQTGVAIRGYRTAERTDSLGKGIIAQKLQLSVSAWNKSKRHEKIGVFKGVLDGSNRVLGFYIETIRRLTDIRNLEPLDNYTAMADLAIPEIQKISDLAAQQQERSGRAGAGVVAVQEHAGQLDAVKDLLKALSRNAVSSIEALNRELADANGEIERLDRDGIFLRNRVSGQDADLASEHARSERLAATIADIRRQFDDYRGRADVTEAEKNVIIERLAWQVRGFIGLAAQLRQGKADLSTELNQAITDLNGQLQEARQDFEQAEIEIGNLGEAIRERGVEIVGLNQNLDDAMMIFEKVLETAAWAHRKTSVEDIFKGFIGVDYSAENQGPVNNVERMYRKYRADNGYRLTLSQMTHANIPDWRAR